MKDKKYSNEISNIAKNIRDTRFMGKNLEK
jgi:hypothetical protein